MPTSLVGGGSLTATRFCCAAILVTRACELQGERPLPTLTSRDSSNHLSGSGSEASRASARPSSDRLSEKELIFDARDAYVPTLAHDFLGNAANRSRLRSPPTAR